MDEFGKIGDMDAAQLSRMYAAAKLALIPGCEWIREITIADLYVLLGEILTDRQREVFYYRWGLTGGGMQPLDTTGAHFKITRERVRQLEQRAIGAIKAHAQP